MRVLPTDPLPKTVKQGDITYVLQARVNGPVQAASNLLLKWSNETIVSALVAAAALSTTPPAYSDDGSFSPLRRCRLYVCAFSVITALSCIIVTIIMSDVLKGWMVTPEDYLWYLETFLGPTYLPPFLNPDILVPVAVVLLAFSWVLKMFDEYAREDAIAISVVFGILIAGIVWLWVRGQASGRARNVRLVKQMQAQGSKGGFINGREEAYGVN
ncbi:hypothetical protein TSOC_000338 [Tetrabaena socialis]|uniref:Uncharacterized protein n=1 Tax=Tetrabaena socialis TaxID=47790 RepID=A0A2J8AJG3_9CHLO|nr:hypothetical protein TSOC_000338 [Tetrabaena socialis]|eukprot:PNH12662.1 hypothetical protein TSOC_000338 [Tetrabaena socialis]